MKLCVTATGKDIHATTDISFGRAPIFLIINTETMEAEVVENTAATAGHGAEFPMTDRHERPWQKANPWLWSIQSLRPR